MTKLSFALALLLAACHKCPQATAPTPTGSGSPVAVADQRHTEIQFSCAGTYVLTTGTPDGECSTTAEADGRITGGTCDDKHGNSATAVCQWTTTPDGDQWSNGRCVKTTGQGNCSGGSGY